MYKGTQSKAKQMEEETKEVWFSFKVLKTEKDKAIAEAVRNNSDLSKELRKVVAKLANNKVAA